MEELLKNELARSCIFSKSCVIIKESRIPGCNGDLLRFQGVLLMPRCSVRPGYDGGEVVEFARMS